MAKATYKAAGVDIDKGNLFTQMIKELIRQYWPDFAEEIGGFAGGGSIPEGAVVVQGSTDGTGTAAILAALMGIFSGIGQSGVAMGVVDTYVAGARPFYLLDTLNVGRLYPEKHIEIIQSVIRGCKLAGTRLIGGETAELPDMFKYSWMFNLDVAVIGFPDRSLAYIPVQKGQHLYGWPSNGAGSNGFSMLRKVHRLKLEEDGLLGFLRKLFRWQGSMSKVMDNMGKPRNELDGFSLAEHLVVPPPFWIQNMEVARQRGVRFAGHAHITGGGMVENIPRILPDDLKVMINKSSIIRPPIFRYTQEMGGVHEDEMDRVFNQGVMVASIVDPDGPKPEPPAFWMGIVEKRKERAGELEPQVQFSGCYFDC